MTAVNHSFVSQFTDISKITVDWRRSLENDTTAVDHNALVIDLAPSLQLFVTRADAERLHQQLGKVLATAPPESGPVKETGHCPDCDGSHGNHGLVHIRRGNGGGHNEPCPHAEVLP